MGRLQVSALGISSNSNLHHNKDMELYCIPPLLIADGADYTGGLYTATFSGSSTTSVRVPTLPDNVLEGLEYFTGVIQVPPNTTTNYLVTAGSPDTAMINIIDATSEFNICPTLSSYVHTYNFYTV